MKKIKIWLRNLLAGIIVKRFDTLQEMKEWLGDHVLLLTQFGILRWDIFSPLRLSCILTPENVDRSSIDNADLKELVEKMKRYYGEHASFDKGEGKICGIEVTHEDYYWVLDQRGKKYYITCINPLMVKEDINGNIIRVLFI